MTEPGSYTEDLNLISARPYRTYTIFASGLGTLAVEKIVESAVE
jgi:hypothetical protein